MSVLFVIYHSSSSVLSVISKNGVSNRGEIIPKKAVGDTGVPTCIPVWCGSDDGGNSYPSLPDFDVVLNCRDGPLLPRTRKAGPLVLAYSAVGVNAEIAFPDYTLWGLPGKVRAQHLPTRARTATSRARVLRACVVFASAAKAVGTASA